MTIGSNISSLKAAVKAAQEEFDLAVVFHEVWKPTAYDKDLHKRMGRSYASHAFRIVRVSLRREMLLALMRLWDTSPGAIRIDQIARIVCKPDILKALAKERAAKFGDIDVERQMLRELRDRAEQVDRLVAKYSRGGSHFDILSKLRVLRHEHFAHRRLVRSVELSQSKMDRDIESFYQDNSRLISLLLSVVLATAYDPQEAAKVFQFYTDHFWAGVRGENSEGHPNYPVRTGLKQA